MTVILRVQRPLSENSTFMKAARHAAGVHIQERLDKAAEIALEEFDKFVKQYYVTDRSSERRKTGRHLLGSGRCIVVETSDRPSFALRMSSLAEHSKVWSLDRGSRPHKITGNPWLIFPASSDSKRVPSDKGKSKRPAFATAYGGMHRGALNKRVRTHEVNHPGTEGTHFMEKALEAAVKRVYHNARLRKRTW